MLKFIYTDMELTDCKGRISKSQTLAHLEDETLLNDEKIYVGIKWNDFDYLSAKYPILKQFMIFGKNGKRKIYDFDVVMPFAFAKETKAPYIPIILKITHKENKNCTLQDLMNEPIKKVFQYCKEHSMSINMK